VKSIDEIYKEWSGVDHTVNSCHPVHDSAECQEFAEYYHKEMQPPPVTTKQSDLVADLKNKLTPLITLAELQIMFSQIRDERYVNELKPKLLDVLDTIKQGKTLEKVAALLRKLQ
jgi:hypothetical protein